MSTAWQQQGMNKIRNIWSGETKGFRENYDEVQKINKDVETVRDAVFSSKDCPANYSQLTTILSDSFVKLKNIDAEGSTSIELEKIKATDMICTTYKNLETRKAVQDRKNLKQSSFRDIADEVVKMELDVYQTTNIPLERYIRFKDTLTQHIELLKKAREDEQTRKLIRLAEWTLVFLKERRYGQHKCEAERRIEEALEKIIGLEKEVRDFAGLKNGQQHYYLYESLLRSIGELDQINLEKHQQFRNDRKSAIQRAHRVLKDLDKRAKDPDEARRERGDAFDIHYTHKGGKGPKKETKDEGGKKERDAASDAIGVLLERCEEWEREIPQAYQHNEVKCEQLHGNFSGILVKFDQISSSSDSELRSMKKEAINYVKACIKKLPSARDEEEQREAAPEIDDVLKDIERLEKEMEESAGQMVRTRYEQFHDDISRIQARIDGVVSRDGTESGVKEAAERMGRCMDKLTRRGEGAAADGDGAGTREQDDSKMDVDDQEDESAGRKVYETGRKKRSPRSSKKK